MRKKIRIFKPHRLKIVEQVIIVSFFSLIIPLIVTGIIVNNINRQALARELTKTATMLVQSVDNNIYRIFEADDAKIKEIATAVKYMPTKSVNNYLNDYVKGTDDFSELKIITVNPKNKPAFIQDKPFLNHENGLIIVNEPIGNNRYLIGTMDKNFLQKSIFKGINESTRQIYILSDTDKPIFSLNYNENDFNKIKSILPHDMKPDEIYSIGGHNQPIICMKTAKNNVTIIVNTTERITEEVIYTSAWKILVSMLVSTVSSILFIILYISYLYLNIRQLFKGIMALTKGNYSRKIRLLKNILTPYEVVFLATEFNKAADEINLSYSKLAQQNKELERLNNFRSNLVDTVSHEFRTPLTSIKGYTSRLMRHDIVIDKETLNKSLKIIKQQSERLSRMVEDLLVIPDIEGAKLNMTIEPVNLAEAIEMSLISVKNIENREVINNVTAQNIYIHADKDRFEQVMINLIENANKYGTEDTPLVIDAIDVKGKVTIIMKNNADYIDKKTVSKLFEKFVRVDDKTTRTTRGTGLGLFIVRGLLQAMNGNIFIKSTENNEFYTYVVLPSEEV